MRCYLSIFIERFGYQSHCRLDIKEFSSLRLLDEYTTFFSDSKELREYHKAEVEDFKKKFDHGLYVWRYYHPGKKNNGTIYANFLTRKGIATIAIMYKGDRIIGDNVAYNHLRYFLNDDKIFEKLVKEKSYLLLDLDNEDESFSIYDFACEYIEYRDVELKHEVINRLMSYIKQMDDEKRYFYFRSLVNMCKLREPTIYLDDGSKICYDDHLIDGKYILTKDKKTRFTIDGNGFIVQEMIQKLDEELIDEEKERRY